MWNLDLKTSQFLLLCRYIQGRANENLKSAIKFRNTARLSCKLTTMILMV